MKIDGWSIAAFGPLVQWEVADLARHRVLVVLGPNESGKSALFEFFLSALFGFSPARADRHPYRPWDGRFPEGRLDVVLRDGCQARIGRRLTSRPVGQLTAGDETRGLANHPAPWVEYMDRPVFKNVYALTQEEALDLGNQGWQVVQDLLAGSSFDFLRSSREVVDELDTECRSLWRPTRHSQPKARQIMDRLGKLRDGLPASRQIRERIELNVARTDAIESELRATTSELQRIELSLERDATLAPLVRRADRMDQLNAQADELLPEDALPDDTPDRRAALVERLEELSEARESHRRGIKACEELIEIDDPTRRLLDERVSVERQDRELALASADLDRIESMNAELQRRDGALREGAVRALVSEHVDAESGNAIFDLSVAELRGRLRASSEARRRLDAVLEAVRAAESERARLEQVLADSESMQSQVELDARLRILNEIESARRLIAARPPPTRTFPVALLVALGLVGVVVLGLGLGVGGVAGTLLAIAGAAGLAAAVVLGLSSRPGSAAATASEVEARLRELDLDANADIPTEITRTQAARDTALRRELDAERLVRAQDAEKASREVARTAETAYHAARAEFLGVIADVPVAPIHREAPSEGLARDLEEMRQSIRDTRRLRRNRDEVSQRLTTWRAEVERLRQALDVELPADPFEATPAARRALGDALEAERVAFEAATELAELRERLETCDQERDTATLQLERMDTSLADLDPDGAEPLAGLDRFRQALELRNEARRVLSDLERESPGWRERVFEAEELVATGESVGLSDAERVEYRLRAEELRAIGQDLAAETGQLTTERDRLSGEPGPAHTVGEIRAAEEQLKRVRQDHDRLALLRQAVQAAEHSYRERYQAPLLTAAARHLHRFTEARYDLLTVDSVAAEHERLQVRRTGSDFPEAVDTPLSRGTIQQIYFALRLAMVDLVEGDEPLPLFLDEMFVNWDPGRTTSGLAALADMPGDRQVFLFTADPFWAERAIQDVPAHIVRTPAA